MDNILSNKFAYYADYLKNQSAKDDEKRINDFELQLKFLDSIMNGYNLLNLDNRRIEMMGIRK